MSKNFSQFIKFLKSNIRKNLWHLFEFTVLMLTILLMLNRIRYGIDFSDESWYIAEPYAVAELGALPFINNVMQAPGFTLPLALIFKVFCTVTGSTEGIVLFSRVLFVITATIVSAATICIINKFTNFKIPYIALPAMITGICINSLFDINYNTIGVMYFPLILSLVFAEYNNEESNKQRKWGILAGIMATRTVMGTPQLLIGLAVIFVFLLMGRKYKRIQGILIGCVSVCVVLIIYTMIFGGIKAFPNWISMYFSQGYFLIESRANWENIKDSFIQLIYPAILMAVGLKIAKLILKKHELDFGVFLPCFVLSAIALGLLLSVKANDYVGFYLTCWTWFLPYCYCLFSVNKYNYRNIVMAISFSYLCTYLFASFANVYGSANGRTYWLFTSILLTICLLVNDRDRIAEDAVSFNKWRHVIISFLFIVLTLFKLWGSYEYVHRDGPIRQLNTKISEGIWKGLYTTEDRANCSVELEKYLKSVTAENDSVLCLDWVSFAYLMINGKICSPTTLDASHYTYHLNTPRLYYDYFELVSNVPSKILYVNYGRDEKLSIENTEWKFNCLVNSYYYLSDEFENELFSVKEFILKDVNEALQLISNYTE